MSRPLADCLDGGTVHPPFESAGLDVRPHRGAECLVQVRRCVWCHLEQIRPVGGTRWTTTRKSDTPERNPR